MNLLKLCGLGKVTLFYLPTSIFSNELGARIANFRGCGEIVESLESKLRVERFWIGDISMREVFNAKTQVIYLTFSLHSSNKILLILYYSNASQQDK
jgi:hypothetical protein